MDAKDTASDPSYADVLSVVIPVYNCAECLEPLCRRLGAVLQRLEVGYEILLVEDRGRDRSWQVIRELAAAVPAIKGIRLSRNFGQHAAISAGIGRSRGSHIIVMDCDLQDPPEVIPELYARARCGFDVVFARRRQRGQRRVRQIASTLYFKFLNQVSDTKLDGFYSALSIVSRKVADAFLRMHDKDRHYIFAIQWLGFSSAVVEYDQAARPYGRSAYSFPGLVRQAVNGVVFQTTVFLRWIIYFGFIIAATGFLASLVAIHRYLFYNVQPGWTSLVVLGLLLGGANITAVGVIGLYIGRIFDQVRGRPLYLIDEEVGQGTTQVPPPPLNHQRGAAAAAADDSQLR